jgi:hypothetical protein
MKRIYWLVSALVLIVGVSILGGWMVMRRVAANRVAAAAQANAETYSKVIGLHDRAQEYLRAGDLVEAAAYLGAACDTAIFVKNMPNRPDINLAMGDLKRGCSDAINKVTVLLSYNDVGRLDTLRQKLDDENRPAGGGKSLAIPRVHHDTNLAKVKMAEDLYREGGVEYDHSQSSEANFSYDEMDEGAGKMMAAIDIYNQIPEDMGADGLAHSARSDWTHEAQAAQVVAYIANHVRPEDLRTIKEVENAVMQRAGEYDNAVSSEETNDTLSH